jgi:hypothetical protein
MHKWIVAVFVALISLPALAAGRLGQVEIIDDQTGRSLPVYFANGRHYVAGVPGHEYSIRIRNRAGVEVLAVVSVDGVNVVTGETAAVSQGGYILHRRQRFDIRGWRKSLEQVASFYFADLDESYAVRTGRPDNIGVIGVALFRPGTAAPFVERSAGRAEPAAPAARESEEKSDSAARLGTGHGRRIGSQVRYGQFERASEVPDEIVTIYYDSHDNLIAQGIIPAPRPGPQPFPEGFVPDPPNG